MVRELRRPPDGSSSAGEQKIRGRPTSRVCAHFLRRTGAPFSFVPFFWASKRKAPGPARELYGLCGNTTRSDYDRCLTRLAPRTGRRRSAAGGKLPDVPLVVLRGRDHALLQGGEVGACSRTCAAFARCGPVRHAPAHRGSRIPGGGRGCSSGHGWAGTIRAGIGSSESGRAHHRAAARRAVLRDGRRACGHRGRQCHDRRVRADEARTRADAGHLNARPAGAAFPRRTAGSRNASCEQQPERTPRDGEPLVHERGPCIPPLTADDQPTPAAAPHGRGKVTEPESSAGLRSPTVG